MMPDWPEGLVPYRQTPDFTESTVPAALLENHSTKASVWARIVVLEGALEYTIDALGVRETLLPGRAGVVPPAVPHRVKPLGRVRFHLVFHRPPEQAGTT